MGSENPSPPTLTRNFSFEKLSGMLGLNRAPRAAAAFDFTGDNEDMPFSDTASLGDMPHHSAAQSVSSLDEEKPVRRRKISAPLIPYVPPEESGNARPAGDASPVAQRRMSHGDRPHSHPAKTAMILNWLAYKPMPACAQIDEVQEGEGGKKSGVTQKPMSPAHDQRTTMDMPVTRAVMSMDGLSRCRKKSATREFNVIAPSNW